MTLSHLAAWSHGSDLPPGKSVHERQATPSTPAASGCRTVRLSEAMAYAE